ncbi:MAG TPA: flavin reductase family protein [Candidatus Aphodovivens avicola]|nr:flavin reductase family protein [Candidatus Aphodovivens avicola]
MDPIAKRNLDLSMRAIEGRDVAASLGPRPIAVIGARDGDRIGFATVAWAMPVSHTPPMVAFALRSKSYTFGLVRNTRRFSVSVPDASIDDAVKTIEICGNKTGSLVDKSELIDWRLLPAAEKSIKEPLPALAGALTVLECRMEKIEPAGDHLLVIGYVDRAWSRGGSDARGRLDATDALLCVQHDLFATAK